MYYSAFEHSYLEHHGIKGQKWGVRRKFYNASFKVKKLRIDESSMLSV